jgi:NodT family efflux transporter outer membrane factor (OMF) lipoprotein
MFCDFSRSRRGFVLIASLTALLTGCTLGPDFKPPAAPGEKGYTSEGVPQPPSPGGKDTDQRFAVGKRISGDWWTLFQSERLNQVLQQAVGGNRTLVAAQATLRQAHQVVTQAAGALYPQVNLNGAASRQKNSLATQGIPGTTSIFNIYSIAPTVSYVLDPFGGNRRRVEQQGALAKYQDYQLDAAYLTLTGNAVTQALNIASARAQIKAVEDIIASDQHNLQLVQTEFKAGEATRMDIESAQSQLATDRTLLPPLRQQLSVARHALSVLVGRSPASWSPPNFDLADFTLPNELPVSLPSDLVHQRPDILSSEAQLHAASAAIGVATAQLYPNITLTGSIGQEALSTAKLFTSASSIWSIGANLAAPIFQGGALEAQRQASINAYQAALATYEQTVLQSFGQVADVLQALNHDAELLRDQRRALESADASLRLTRTTYSAGNVSLLQVLDAQRLYEQARLGYVRAEAQRYLDTVQLYVAMGGGWQEWREQTAHGRSTAPAAKSGAPAIEKVSARTAKP